MEGKRRDEEDLQDSLVVEDSMRVKFPLVPFATCLLPLQLILQGVFFAPKRSKKNCIVKSHKDPTSWIIWCQMRHQITCHLPPCPVFQNSATTVARISQESRACLKTCLWSMEKPVPQKYCKTDTWPSWRHTEGSALPSATSPSRQGSTLKIPWREVRFCWHLDLQVLRAGLWGN